MCVQLFTAFEEAILKLHACTLVSAIKSKMATISIETKYEEKSDFVFSSECFTLIIINIQLNELVKKLLKHLFIICELILTKYCRRQKEEEEREREWRREEKVRIREERRKEREYKRKLKVSLDKCGLFP